MEESFDVEKEVSDSKDGTKQVTLDVPTKVAKKKEKFVCEEL